MEGVEALPLTAIQAEQLDAAFQFWLASTFSVIVAVHTIGKALDTKLKLTISVLYLLLTSYTILKTIGDLQQIAYYEDFVNSAGFDVPDQFTGVAGYVRIALYVIGIVATIAFVWTTGRQARE